MKKSVLILILILASFFVIATAHGQEINEDMRVEKNFTAWKKHCSKCHGDGERATEFGISKRAPNNLFTTTGEKNIEEIKEYIRNHKDVKSDFKKELTNEEIEVLSKFLKLGFMLQKLQKNSNVSDELKPIFINKNIDDSNDIRL